MNYRMNVSLALCPLCQFQCRYGSSLPARTVQYSAVQRSSVQYITLQYSAVQYQAAGHVAREADHGLEVDVLHRRGTLLALTATS